MDVLDQVRNIGEGTEISEAQVARARHAMQSEITGRSAAKVERVRRPWLRVGVVTGTAAALAAGVFVANALVPVDTTDPDSPPPIFGPSVATAAEVLEQTAARVTAPDAGIQAGQFLLIEETQRFTEYAIEDVGIGELMPMGNRSNAELAYITERTVGLYVPANREDEWVWDLRDTATVVKAFGGSVADAEAVHARVSDFDGTPDLWRLPGGRAPEGGTATLDNREEFAEMPRDAQALLNWYRDRSQIPDAETDGWIVWTLSSMLTANLAPADLRATMFEALALIEGVEIAEQDGNTSVFSYRVDFGDWTRTTMFTVDIEKALVTAVTDASVPSGGSIVPDTVPDEQRSVVVSIVDEAP